jgi:hypothetical protein
LLTVEAKLHQALGDHAYITFSADNCLEVMAPVYPRAMRCNWCWMSWRSLR